MAMQIVTGYTGTAHIKSAHDRSRNAGVVGRGSYVLSTGNMLAAKMQTANTLRIVDGDLMLQGTHATIEAGTHEDLAIDNGTQGMKRNDLVVARYERLSGEPKTESVTLRVIKGSPSSGAAADPDHVEGDVLKGDLVAEMPLYRVPIDGITPGKPVPLFDIAPTIDALRDSLSQTEDALESKTFPAMTVEARSRAGACTVRLRQDGGVITREGRPNVCARLKVAPAVEVTALFGVQGNAWGVAKVDRSGAVSIFHLFSSGDLTWDRLDVSLTFVIG